MFLKKLIKLIMPPILLFPLLSFRSLFKNNKKNLSSTNGWFAGFNDFNSVEKICSGYDCNTILEKCSNSLSKIKSGKAVYERDSVLFNEPQYSYQLLTSLLWIASSNSNKLSVVDFGGSLGSSYFQNRYFLSHLEPLEWSVVEQTNFVKEGKAKFEDNILKFYYDIDECLTERCPQVIVLSSVIQYIKKPYQLLDEILSKDFKYIIFDLTGFVDSEDDLITRQIVPEKIYKADYPCWFFNLDNFLNYFKKKYDLILKFDSYIGENIKINNFIKDGSYKGFLFRKKVDNKNI